MARASRMAPRRSGARARVLRLERRAAQLRQVRQPALVLREEAAVEEAAAGDAAECLLSDPV